MADILPEPAPPALIMASAQGLCPLCGATTLFDGPIKFAARCRACGLDFGQFNVGDGPAAFLTMIVGGVILALALVVELNVHPPLWLHMILWTPLIVVAVMGSLRVAKGALLTLEYRNKAREGKLIPPEPLA